MAKTINESACPFCSQDNQCRSNNSCWCSTLIVPTALTDLVPEYLKNKSCICNGCIINFNYDPIAFIKKVTSR